MGEAGRNVVEEHFTCEALARHHESVLPGEPDAPVSTPQTVSVVIPTYNRLGYLMEALESVFRQSRPPDEVIVVDDGSTDGTEEAITELGHRVRYLRQRNAGPGAARNRGLRAVQGEWITFLDSDDLWMPDTVARQIEFCERNPGLDFVFGLMALFDATSEASEPEILDRSVYAYCQAHAADLRDLHLCLLKTNPVPTSTVMFRRSAMERVGFFREDLRCAEDYDLWFRWALSARCGFVDRVLMRRRIHAANVIGDHALMLESNLAVLEELTGRRALRSPSEWAALEIAIHRRRYQLANHYYRGRDYQRALEVLRRIRPRLLATMDERARWLAKLVIASVRAKAR